MTEVLFRPRGSAQASPTPAGPVGGQLTSPTGVVFRDRSGAPTAAPAAESHTPIPDRAEFFSPEAQLSGVDKGVYQAVKGAVMFPLDVAKQQVQAAVQGDPSALIPGGPVAKAEAERVVGEGAGAIQSAKQGDILGALYQALSAVPGIGGMYKDAATDVIQGNPGVGAGKVLGNVMAARAMPDVVPPAAAVAGRGIEAAAKAAQSPLAKRFATNVAVPGAAGAVGTAVGGPGLGAAATYLTREWIKDNAATATTKATEAKSAAAQAAEAVSKTTDLAERAAATKRAESFKAISDAWEAAADRVKAEEARIEAAQAAAEKAAQADSIKAAQLEVKTLESADTAAGKQIAAAERTAAKGEAQGQKIDLKQLSETAKRDAETAARLLKDTKARETASFQAAGVEVRILEAAQKAQASAEAELAAAVKAMENAGTKEAAAAERAVRVATDKAAKAAERTKAAEGRAEAAQIRREYRQRTQMDKAAAREAAKAKPVEAPAAPAPQVNLQEAFENAASKTADISDTISKATKQNRRLVELGVSLEERRAVLAKNKNRLPDETIETIITSDSKTPIAPNAVMVKSLMRSGNTPTDAWKIMRDAGVKENGQDAFFQAARDELSMMKAAADDGTGPALTPQQEFQYAQIRRGVKSTKKLRIEEIQELPEGQKPDKYVPVPKLPKKP